MRNRGEADSTSPPVAGPLIGGPLLAPSGPSPEDGTVRTSATSGSVNTAAFAVVYLACFAVGCGLVLHDLLLPHGLFKVAEYDDGVYFGGALRISEGLLPYKDFVFLQPPGIAVLMAPLGLVSHTIGARDGLAIARVLTAVVSGVNPLLVAYLLRHRGLFASLVGGLLFAVFPAGYSADHTLLLEPWLVLFCLLGAVLCFSSERVAGGWRLALGGACFGVAGAVKTWAIVPVVVLAIVLLVLDRRLVLRFAGGVAAAFLAICLPFFLEAPRAFVTDVITSQLSRQTVLPTSLNVRLSAFTGITWSNRSLEKIIGPHSLWPNLAAGLLVLVLLLGTVVPLLRGRGSPLEWFLVAGAAGVVAMTFVPEEFYTHYAYFTAPFLAAGVGFGAGRLARFLDRQLSTWSGSRRTKSTFLSLGAVAAAGLFLALVLPSELAEDAYLVSRYGDPGPAIAAVIPMGACVLTDSLSVTISADRADAGAPGCPAMVDATGTWITFDPAHPPQRLATGPKDPALVALWERDLLGAKYVLLSGECAFRVPFTPALVKDLDSRYRLLTRSPVAIFLNTGSSHAAPVSNWTPTCPKPR